MTYDEYIQSILETRGRFITDKNVIKERHHILMKSLGGTNDESNLIDLIGSEHYEAHKLLALENPDCREAQSAWWMMSHNTGANVREYEVSAEDWEQSRERWIKSFSGENHPNFGKPITEKQKEKISKTRKERGVAKGEKNYFYGKRYCGESNYWYGKSLPVEARQKMSKAKKEYFKTHDGINKGKSPSSETREKLRLAMTGKNLRGSHPRARKVYCDDKVFDCVLDCADFYGVTKTTIFNNLKSPSSLWKMRGLCYFEQEKKGG